MKALLVAQELLDVVLMQSDRESQLEHALLVRKKFFAQPLPLTCRNYDHQRAIAIHRKQMETHDLETFANGDSGVSI